jgi:hypothetical protein
LRGRGAELDQIDGGFEHDNYAQDHAHLADGELAAALVDRTAARYHIVFDASGADHVLWRRSTERLLPFGPHQILVVERAQE